MRVLMFAAALLAAGPAFAADATYVDPKGRFSFSYPADWPIEAPRVISAGVELVVIGGADVDCSWLSLERPDLASISLESARKTAAQEIPPDLFFSVFRGLTQIEGLQAAQVERREQSIWVVHLGRLSPSPQPVVAALHLRPGLEMRAICRSYDGKDRSAEFEKLLLSFSSPRDAEWAAASAAAAAAPPAPAPVPAATPPEPEAKGKKKK